MIVDHLSNVRLYASLSPRIAKALAALQKGDLQQAADGRYPIDGEDVFALVQQYQTKPAEQGKWEAHRKYLDIQYVISGTEAMGYTTLDQMKVKEPYNEQKDIVFFEGQGDRVTVRAGMFAMFFPQDAHMPTLSPATGENHVRKIVVKVRV